MVAKITMTELYYYHAWQARGTGYANTVTPEVWQLSSERLKQAWTYIRDLDSKLDPVIFDETIGILRDVNTSRQTMDAVDDAATKSFPRYFHFCADRAELLQQKWLGGAGELENYTQSLPNNPGGEDGQIAYTYADSRLSF
jgi:hypothetical protein